MAAKSSFKPFSPIYWPTWIALGALWVVARLASYPVALAMGRTIGRFVYRVAGRRRHITEVNTSLCFPELSQEDQNRMVLEHFESAGISLLMIGFSWWASDRKLEPLTHTKGFEYLEQGLKSGRGILMVGVHFVDLDLIGRMFGHHFPFAVMYRQHENPVIEWAIRRNRERRFSQAIPRGDVRTVLRTLKKNGIVWVAADQAQKGKHTTLVPFFGEPASTSTIISRIARISDAPVLMGYGYRLPGNDGYLLETSAPFEDFPGESLEAATGRINLEIEAAVRKAPAQYLWMHRRFKKRIGLPDPY